MATHPIVHVEIPAKNTKGAGTFYADVFGWNVHTEPSFDYTMFQVEGGPGGGFVSLSEGTPGHVPTKPGDVLVYIGTDDIEASLKAIETHGGKVLVTKQEIPQTGWFAVFSDPTGNRMALYTAMERTS